LVRKWSTFVYTLLQCCFLKKIKLIFGSKWIQSTSFPTIGCSLKIIIILSLTNYSISQLLIANFLYLNPWINRILKLEALNNLNHLLLHSFTSQYLTPLDPGSFINQFDLIWFIVFNATFNNISAISWRSVLVVEEAGVPGENHRPWASNW
jgi:hypothetical protein